MQSLVRFLLVAATVSGTAHGQVFDEQFEHWPVDLKINGRIVAARSLSSPELLRGFISNDARRVHALIAPEVKIEVVHDYLTLFSAAASEEDPPEPDAIPDDGPAPSDDAQPESGDANGPGTSLQLTMSQLGEAVPTDVHQADVVLCLGSDTTEASALAQYSEEMSGAVDGGATLIVVGPMAETLGVAYSDDDLQQPTRRAGLGLLPDCIVETAYDGGERSRNRLLSLLAAEPRSVGIGLASDTALVLAGRRIVVAGAGTATALLMANERQPIRTQTIRPPGDRRRFSDATLLDLTEWRRDAIDRTLPPFPPLRPRRPYVENGTLVIVGGGGMPEGLMRRIIELAGGTEQARMVYVPCAEADDVGERQSTVESWKRMGVQQATFIHTKDRRKANDDEEFLEPLRNATGLWFGGGRQWNFADSYYGTTAHRLMKDVLRRGGVIGGSSAGASIQARYLARATPIGNFDIMAPGYERGGLGFLEGVAIDQHFSQRRRQKDMTQLVNRYPQLLGIGIDEATAIIVQKSVAEVVGRGRVFFYDRSRPVYPDRPDYIALPAGSRFDLEQRKVLVDTSENDETPDAAADKPGK